MAKNIIIIELYFMLILIKTVSADTFIDIKKLSFNNDYFVILDTGLYLYDSNFKHCALIHQFNEKEYKTNVAYNKINITELYNEQNAYILCLINEYLFILDEYTYKVMNFTINEINNFTNNNDYYNIMPYKIENNNISFIIAFNNDTNSLYFYSYNFELEQEKLYNPEIIIKDNLNIQNKMIRCEMNSNLTFIICFYHSKNNTENYFVSKTFIIENKTDGINLSKIYIYSYQVSSEIKQIKIAKSYNDKFFACIFLVKGRICFINKDNYYQFETIITQKDACWPNNYKVFYFNETNEFMFLSKKDFNISSIIFNNYNDSYGEGDSFLSEYIEYSLIYNNGYKIVYNSNFTGHGECNNISIYKNIKQTIEEIKYLINNLENKEELITKLNEFIKIGIILNDINNNENLIIKNDEENITISFTTTNDEKLNENNINLIAVNLGDCEYNLKNYYKISNESNLYILKIDIKQKGKNYPLIEYEVFYPLYGENNEILDLNLCNDTNIELSIPIIINDTIDKYNPKSNYYNDICTKATSKYNTDITLYDRRIEFINNDMSLCEENCELISYDNIYRKAKCSCKVKTSLSLDNIELDNKNILKNFIDIKKITNIEIVKCYKIVFNINNIKSNYGSFIILFIFILYFISIIIFYCKSLKKLIKKTIEIINSINNKGNHITVNDYIYSSNKGIHKKRLRKRNIKNKKIENKSTKKK